MAITTDERDGVFLHLMSIFTQVPGTAVVSEDHGVVIMDTADQFPTIVLLDMGDKVEEADFSFDGGHNRRAATVGIAFIVKGTTTANARRDLAAFIRLTKRYLYDQILDSELITYFEEVGMSHVAIRPSDSRILHQIVQCEIGYIEDIHQLLQETL